MDIELTFEQFETLTKNMITNPDGSTNKKCPICNNDVIVKKNGNSGIIMCKSKNCFSVDFRGV